MSFRGVDKEKSPTNKAFFYLHPSKIYGAVLFGPMLQFFKGYKKRAGNENR